MNNGICIGVFTHNAAFHLDPFLSAFFETRFNSPSELVVVDQNSTDTTYNIVSGHAAKGFIRFVKCDAKASFTTLKNIAAAKARYPQIACADINTEGLLWVENINDNPLQAQQRIADPCFLKGSLAAKILFHEKRLNILFVSHSSIHSNSGYHVQFYAHVMSQRGACCIVASPRDNKGEKPIYNGLQVKAYKEILADGFQFPDGRGPDIVHAWTPREKVRTFCSELSKTFGFQTIIHMEDNEEYFIENTLERSFSDLTALPLDELDQIVPPHRFHPVRGMDWLKQVNGLTLIIDSLHRFNTKGLPSFVLPAPVDERLFYPRPINYELRKRLSIPEDHVVLAYIGNVRSLKKKEALALYRALALLNRQGFPTTLIRTGSNYVSFDDKDQSWYKAFEKPMGWVERTKVPEIMAAADILVQPGWPGPFDDQRIPAKLPEYFAMGRPVILPRANIGLKVEHGKEAFVLDRADGVGIARAVKAISGNKEMAQRLSDKAVDFYLEKIAQPHIANRLGDFYGSILVQQPQSKTPPRPTKPFAVSFSYTLHKSIEVEIIALKKALEPSLEVVPCLETALQEGRLPKTSPWIGFVRTIPAKLPSWLAKIPPYKAFTDGNYFQSFLWKESMNGCRGLFVQSTRHAHNLQPFVKVPVYPIRSKTPKMSKTWSWEAFDANPSKKIIQVGWWMQRIHAIHALPLDCMEKVWIRPASNTVDSIMPIERDHLLKRHVLFDFMLDSVTVMTDPSPDEYDCLLEKNIVFVHYYDAKALDLLLDCIARQTPILINPFAAFREYLGDDYPLYYYFYEDAANKAADVDLVRKAHEHLRQISEKFSFSEAGGMTREIKQYLEVSP